MKTAFSLLASALLFIVTGANANSINLCKNLTGVWQGFYHGTEGLFVMKKNTPITLTLLYKKGKIFGYVVPPSKFIGMYTTGPGELFFANCHSDKITHIALLPQHYDCGETGHQINVLKSKKTIVLPIFWENAMTDTVFIMHLL